MHHLRSDSKWHVLLTITVAITHAGGKSPAPTAAQLGSGFCPGTPTVVLPCMSVKSISEVIMSCCCSAVLQVQEERAHCQRLPQPGAGPQ